ncbi:MAG: single-stranded DNA-binding protein [Oscillospiraceae bacterium]|nr:single-stranded DNA-binding protein [Oscillospiraceae bacterium]
MLNHIVIMGRLTKDPELRRTDSGIAVTSFTVAVDRDRAPEGQDKETDFIDCVALRGTAEFVEKYFSKGRMIAVSGRLQIRGWTDKEGNKRRSAEIVAYSCYFADSKKDESQHTSQPQYGAPPTPQYGAPQQSYSQYGYQQPPQQPHQYTQSGFGGYQQSAYPQQGYQPPFPPQGSFAPIEGEDPKLPF